MKKRPSPLAVSRITLAVAAHESPAHALEMIAKLAAGYKAEVSCVLIEDTDMLHAAELPFALEVCRATNLVRRVDPGEIERGLKERATTARKLVAETAERTGATWSFEVLRQRTAIALLDLAKKTDVMMFAAATSLRHPRQATPQGATSALHGSSLDGSIVVLVDRSAASGRALEVARRLAEIRQIPVRVVTIAATDAGLDRLRGQVQRMDGVDASSIQGLCRPQFNDVAAAASASRPATIVLPIGLIAGSSERIHALEDATNSPILIVT